MNWHEVFWIKPNGKNFLNILDGVRELILNLIIFFIIAQIVVFFVRIILSTTFFCEVVQPKVALQPINLLVKLNYITVWKNQRLHQKQVLKKFFEQK